MLNVHQNIGLFAFNAVVFLFTGSVYTNSIVLVNHLPTNNSSSIRIGIAVHGDAVLKIQAYHLVSDVKFLCILAICWVLLKGQKLLCEYEAIMQENINTMKVTEKVEWWSRRRALNRQLQVSLLFILCIACLVSLLSLIHI